MIRILTKRIEYIDALKFLAIFAVISIHCFTLADEAEILHFKIMNFEHLFRFAVPLFLMITGSLLLNKEIELKKYLNRRLKRICYPLIFFTIVLLVFTTLYEFVFSFYWYAWMIIGVVLAIPIINKFIQHSSDREIEYYLVIFIIFSILTQIFHTLKVYNALDISFFYTPISYLILGYYLFNRGNDYSFKKTITLCILLFAISTLLKIAIGNYYYTHDFDTYLDLSFFQIIQVSSVFLFIKTIYSENNILYKILNQNTIKKFILSVSRASYGMFFIQHILILYYAKLQFMTLSLTGTQMLLLILILIISVFLISWIIIVIMSKIPVLNKICGYN